MIALMPSLFFLVLTQSVYKSTCCPALPTWNNEFPTEGRVPVVGLADLAGRHVHVIRGRSYNVPKLTGAISAMGSESYDCFVKTLRSNCGCVQCPSSSVSVQRSRLYTTRWPMIMVWVCCFQPVRLQPYCIVPRLARNHTTSRPICQSALL
ncbi:hypothetical protein H4582DRAFT_1069001 [Lactarius indigo]|nr:hypothetical protein H4582DRAFT_1069001 [Lactarius indigo]